MLGLREPHAIESDSLEAILEAVATTDMFSLAQDTGAAAWLDVPPRRHRHSRLDIRHRTGIVARTNAYMSPLTAPRSS